MAEQTFYSLEEQSSAGDSSSSGQSALQKSSSSAPSGRLLYWRRIAAVRLRLGGLHRSRWGRWGRWGRRRALWLSMRLAASEKVGDSCQKTAAGLLRRRVSLGNLFLKRSDPVLRVRDSLLQHKNALG